jgi:hypothetical protein
MSLGLGTGPPPVQETAVSALLKLSASHGASTSTASLGCYSAASACAHLVREDYPSRIAGRRLQRALASAAPGVGSGHCHARGLRHSAREFLLPRAPLLGRGVRGAQKGRRSGAGALRHLAPLALCPFFGRGVSIEAFLLSFARPINRRQEASTTGPDEHSHNHPSIRVRRVRGRGE